MFTKTCQASPLHSFYQSTKMNKNWLEHFTTKTKPFNFFLTKENT